MKLEKEPTKPNQIPEVHSDVKTRWPDDDMTEPSSGSSATMRQAYRLTPVAFQEKSIQAENGAPIIRGRLSHSSSPSKQFKMNLLFPAS